MLQSVERVPEGLEPLNISLVTGRELSKSRDSWLKPALPSTGGSSSGAMSVREL